MIEDQNRPADAVANLADDAEYLAGSALTASAAEALIDGDAPATDAPIDGDAPATDAPSDDENRERALRVGLSEYELADEDLAILDEDYVPGTDAGPTGPLPILAVIGRPNVGKSTLVNRIIGRREAVVEDVPGVTRDRVSYPAEWAGRQFMLMDTGGWEHNVFGIHARVAEQAEIAITMADAILFVLDTTVGATGTDELVVPLLRKSGKPVVLAANKVDGPSGESDAAGLWSLGLGEPHAISALHGRGTGDLLDAAMAVLPQVSGGGGIVPEGGPRRVALVGRPNVGKSSLLNKVVGSERVVVPATRSTSSSSWPGRPGCSWTRPGSDVGCTRPLGRTSTRRCALGRRSRRPRSRSCWWTRASR